MRILFLSNLFPPFFLGGYEILCEQVARGLAGRGHRCSVLTSDFEAGPGSRHESGLKVHRLLRLDIPFDQPGRVLRWRRRQVGRFNAQVTGRILADEAPDLVFLWSQLRLTLGPARLVEESRIPRTYTLNDPYLESYLPVSRGWSPGRVAHFLGDRLFFRQTTLAGLRLEPALCISRSLKRSLLAHGIPVSGARVLYQGVPLERFPLKREPGRLHDPIRLLYAGQLHSYKGVETFLRAAVLLEGQMGPGAIQVTLAGDGPADARARLDGLASGVSRVAFLGRIAPARMPRLYREQDVLVFPSQWDEPFGLSHLEAMASGTPVVSTTVGGTGEFLRDRENALTFSPREPGELAAAVRLLASKPDLSRKLARNARRMVEDRFSLETYLDGIEDFLGAALCFPAFGNPCGKEAA
ncbi:MAG: glycosyltransferase family 4 protein [Planctomycetota bacterium]